MAAVLPKASSIREMTWVDYLVADGPDPGDYAPGDVVHVGEVALTAVPEEGDGLVLGDGPDKSEYRHVRPARGSVDGEEPEYGGVDAVQVVIGVPNGAARAGGRSRRSGRRRR